MKTEKAANGFRGRAAGNDGFPLAGFVFSIRPPSARVCGVGNVFRDHLHFSSRGWSWQCFRGSRGCNVYKALCVLPKPTGPEYSQDGGQSRPPLNSFPSGRHALACSLVTCSLGTCWTLAPRRLLTTHFLMPLGGVSDSGVK